MLNDFPLNHTLYISHMESIYNLRPVGDYYKIVSSILSKKDKFMEINFKSIFFNSYLKKVITLKKKHYF